MRYRSDTPIQFSGVSLKEPHSKTIQKAPLKINGTTFWITGSEDVLTLRTLNRSHLSDQRKNTPALASIQHKSNLASFIKDILKKQVKEISDHPSLNKTVKNKTLADLKRTKTQLEATLGSKIFFQP